MLIVVATAYFSPDADHTFYRTVSQPPKIDSAAPFPEKRNDETTKLFASGERALQSEQRAEDDKKRRSVTIKYFAPQIVGTRGKAAREMRVGSNLLGFLIKSIDTREPSIVQVLLPHGGESNGVEIAKNSILIGRYSYSGSGEKVFLTFNRIDDPDGNSVRISAQGYDAADYTVGVRGEVFTDKGIKIASQVGLQMFAGMADVLTERESLGIMSGAQAAKPTMRNAVLQGASRAAQDQANSSAQEIQATKGYALISKGTAVIVQLTEDLKH